MPTAIRALPSPAAFFVARHHKDVDSLPPRNVPLMPDFEREFKDYQDWLAPRLDTYEQAIYLYVLRHGPMLGLAEVVIGFKSARRKMAFGIGEAGKPMSEGTCYKKVRSLEQKGCVTIVASERDGTRLRLHLPSEIRGLIPAAVEAVAAILEQIDFFGDRIGRLRIIARENAKCFYCLRQLSPASHVIEHVVSRPVGDNSFRNVVAACRECNNSKGKLAAADHVRELYRRGLLSSDEFDARVTALDHLAHGLLVPPDGPLRDWPSGTAPSALT
jgi:HNH endonuclease